MKTPDNPADEATRINTLRALNLLDSAPEERFDRLTRLAKRLFGVPIALVSLIDADRQWFKSRAGLEVSETSREISFCGHTILDDDVLIVPDALRDERFHDNPLVTREPNIRFYVGYPLTVPNGSTLGTLCLIDRQVRTFTPEDLQLLRDLGSMVEQELAAIQLATMDELTLLSNRRGFLALAQHAINLCQRLQRPASLYYFDLDGLKTINDGFGHAEGDRALTRFSQLLLETFRESDVVARLGGDEFAVFITHAGQTDSQVALSRLEQAVSAHNRQATRKYALKYSVGVIDYDADRHRSIDDLVQAADALMYTQKKKKRAQLSKSQPSSRS